MKHKPLIGAVEGEMLASVFADPAVLVAKAPKVESAVTAAAHLRDLHAEIGILGKFQKTTGFSGGGGLKLVAALDTRHVEALTEFHKAGCGCGRSLWGYGGHKEWFHEWLEKYGTAYKTDKKLVS